MQNLYQKNYIGQLKIVSLKELKISLLICFLCLTPKKLSENLVFYRKKTQNHLSTFIISITKNTCIMNKTKKYH